jgi:hypothetical protein
MNSPADEFQIVTLKSGAKSLRSIRLRETFHPVTGPLAEANRLHVGQQRLAERCRAAVGPGPFVVWDVGLGAAANALAAIEALQGCGTRIEIHSFDQSTAALEFAAAHAGALEYPAPHLEPIRQLLAGDRADLPPRIAWRLHRGDFCALIQTASMAAPDAIFYDPYSSAVNREMWTLEQFARVRSRLDPGKPCLLTNYSRSTAVRVTLLLAGFFVGTGRAVGEKDETTIAANCPGILERPLGCDWLGRIRRSANAAPLRHGDTLRGPIGGEDFERLRSHPQFAQSAGFSR